MKRADETKNEKKFQIRLSQIEADRLFKFATVVKKDRSSLIREFIKYLWNSEKKETPEEIEAAKRFHEFLNKQSDSSKLSISRIIELKKEFAEMEKKGGDISGGSKIKS